MPRGASVADTDWSAYGACETCGCVPGWPCHRGKRQLKNPHPGRPRTGAQPYAADAGGAMHVPPRADDPWGPAPAYDGPPLGPITPPAPCCDTWHPAGTTCPDSYLTDGGSEPGPLRREFEEQEAEKRRRAAEPDPDETTTTTTEDTMALDPTADAVDWTARLDNAERLPSNPAGKKRVDSEVPKDVDRDQYDRPKLVRAQRQPDGSWRVPFYPPGPEPHAGTPIIELEGYTRASTLGNALEDSTGLNRWRSGMVVFGMSRRRDLVLAAQAIPGTEDKKLHRRPLYEIADKALEAAEASSAATVGTALHALTEQADEGTLAVDIGEYQPVLDAYLAKMTGWKVVRSETFVVSDYFHAAGSFDRLITPLEPMALVDQHTGEIITVIMPGDLVVVDLKTSTTADYFGAKFFAQLAVYVTGQDYDRNPESPTYGQRTPLGQRTDFALILHIPQGGDADGEPAADWHWLDMRVGIALAQLACVNLETRKKRFTRTHMRPVLAQPYSPTITDELANQPYPSISGPLPNRDPLGDVHLAAIAPHVVAAQDFPDAEADIVDAELIEDHAMPEQRFPAPAALDPVNAGEPSAFTKLAQEEGIVPGPEETAPLPAGWESKEEQALAVEATTGVPKRLGPQLQEAAAQRKVEDTLIRKIRAATAITGERDSIMDLYERASAAGAWSDRVKAAASARKAELKAREATS